MRLLDLIDNSKTDKNTGHSYIETYEKLFSRLKLSAKNILEIGIYEGGSIKLWHDYFTSATIYGIDVVDAPAWLGTIDRIKTYKANGYEKNFIKNVFEDKKIKFDLIIDDGPHTKESMIFVAKYYSKLLGPNGLLVIEDIQDTNWSTDIISSLPENLKSKSEVIDLRSVKDRYDDILIVVRN